MNILLIGRAFGMIGDSRAFLDCNGVHCIRTLAAAGEEADCHFAPGELAGGVYERVAQSWSPDLIVNWLPELCPPPPGIEELPCKTAAVISDWNLYAPEFHWNLARYDLLLCDKPGSLHYRPWGAQPQYHAPLYGYNPNDHRDLGLERDIDLLFIGNLNPAIHTKRARLLDRLSELAPRFRVEVQSGIWGAAYGEWLNRARIVFNHSIRGEMNLRAFEAPACGALLFLEADNSEVGECLMPDEEVVLYTEENLLERLRHFLDHPDEAAAIARRGQARMQDWAPAARFDRLVEWLAEQPVQGRRFPELPAGTRAAATLVQQAASASPSQRDHARAQAATVAATHADAPAALAAAVRVTFQAAQDAGSLRQEEVSQLLQWLKQALALAPESAALWYNMGEICALMGRPAVAKQCRERAAAGNGLTASHLLFGSYRDPAYIAWLRALATGEATAEMIHAMAETANAE